MFNIGLSLCCRESKSFEHVNGENSTSRKATHVAAFPLAGTGSGTTSEQSTKLDESWPFTASFAMAALNADAILSCWLTNPCHVHAVRGSRARAKSDCRRISPTLLPLPMGSGDSTSPLKGTG